MTAVQSSAATNASHDLKASATGLPSELVTLLSSEQIAARVRELGGHIARDYAGKSLVLVCVLKGSFVFAADLARCIDLPLRLSQQRQMRLKLSFHGATELRVRAGRATLATVDMEKLEARNG